MTKFLSLTISLFISVVYIGGWAKIVDEPIHTLLTTPVNITQHFIDASGGEKEWLDNLSEIIERASLLREGRPCVLHSQTGHRRSVIFRICFGDDECWAAKVSENVSYLPRFATRAVKSLKAIEKHCPNTPHTKVFGDLFETADGTFVYYFSEWIDGAVGWGSHKESSYVDSSNGNQRYNVTFVDNFTKQWAQFFHNLTSCPIPEHECIILQVRRPRLTAVADMVNDNNFLEGVTSHHIAENGTIEASSLTTNIFISVSLLLYNQPPKDWDPIPWSGFEKMALLSWIHLKMKNPESHKFVLYYGDLNPENLLVDKEGQLKYQKSEVGLIRGRSLIGMVSDVALCR